MFLALCRQSHPPEPQFVEGLGIELACRTLRACHSSDEGAPPPRAGLPVDLVSQLTEYVDGHLSEQILVTHLAGHVGLSPDHFARRFKITTAMGPKQFVIKRRVEKVHELLRSGKFNVSEAGREVGFHDLSHLNRCFRNVFGCSPGTVLKTGLPADSSL
jgi:AraC family transcriptional regulator